MADLNYCRVCRAPREPVTVNGRTFLACGTCASPLTTTPAKIPSKETKPDCPQCSSGSVVEGEPGRFHCQKCRAVFERVETNYSGNRPDRNVEQREEYELRQAARRVSGRRQYRD